jgi:hypothetical protein
VYSVMLPGDVTQVRPPSWWRETPK